MAREQTIKTYSDKFKHSKDSGTPTGNSGLRMSVIESNTEGKVLPSEKSAKDVIRTKP
jgi:hypothetical protein